MKRIFFLLLCLCFSVLSFAQRTNETKQLTKQDSLRLQQLLSGQVEIVIDDETQKEIDRLFNPEKWKMKSTPFPKKNMKFETELPRYYISQMDTIDGRGYIRLLPYGPFETPEEEQIYVEIPINKELLAGYDPRLEPAPAGKFTPSALMVGRVSVLRLMPISCWESFSVRKCVQKPVMPKRLRPGRVIELLSKETNAGYMWNTPGSCEFHVEKTGATFG